jgi:hypothetical protein
MKFSARLLALLLGTSLLAACGGSGTSTNDPSDKYVGAWGMTCHAYSDGTSAQYVLTFAKTSATTFSGTNVANVYPNATCIGAGTSFNASGNFSMAVTIVGTKVMQGVTADRVIQTADGKTYYDVMYADSSTLRVGGDGPYDAQGYSNVWHPTIVYTKR